LPRGITQLVGRISLFPLSHSHRAMCPHPIPFLFFSSFLSFSITHGLFFLPIIFSSPTQHHHLLPLLSLFLPYVPSSLLFLILSSTEWETSREAIERSRETKTREPVRLVEPDRCAGSLLVSRGATMVEPGDGFWSTQARFPVG